MNKRFKIKDLFLVSGTKTTSLEDLNEKGKGRYPYVTTQSSNNGVAGFYDYYTEEGNVLTVDSAVAGYCSYREEKFSASDHVEKLTPLFKMNKFIGLYFATVINANQYRFSYGRKANQKKISELEIELPIKIDGTPNYDFMENYIKSLWEGHTLHLFNTRILI